MYCTENDDEYENSIESSLCSESQMSLSVVSSHNSDNTVRRIEQLTMKLESLKPSYLHFEFKAKSRL